MKKRKFGLLAIMSSMALGLMLGACGSNNEPEQPDPEVPGPVEPEKPNPQPEKPEELPAKYDLMKYWSGHMEETVYEVVESDAKTTINYTDVKGENAGGWEYVARSFQYDIANLARFGEYKTLTFTGKLTKTAGTDIVMVKIEGTDGNTLERKFNFGPESKTYELNLGTIKDWSKVNTLLLFANRGTSEMGSGSMEFTEFALSKAETNPDNDIAADLPKVPQDVNLYNGEEKLVVMNSWGYDNKGAIKTEAKDGGYLFTYGDGSKATEEWAYVSARVKSGTKDLATSGLTRIHFKLKGTKGTNALVKFEGLNGLGAKEFMISNLTGEFEEYDLDITELIKKTHEDGSTPEFIAAVFPAAGRKGADLAGEVFLAECFLDKTPAVDPNDRFINHQEGDKVAVKVLQNNEATYTITSEGNNHTVTYKLANVPDYRAIKVLTAGETLKELTELAFTAKSTSKVQIIVKAYDNTATETKIDLEPNVEKEVKINFASTVVDPKKPTVIMIGTSDTSALEGVVTFTNVVFQKDTVLPPEPEVTYNEPTGDEIYIDKFNGYNKDYFQITNENHVTTINFDKPAEAGFDGVPFEIKGENLPTYTHVTGTFKSSVKTSLIIKAYDRFEQKFEDAPTNIEPNTEYTIDFTIDPKQDVFTNKSFIFVGFSADKGFATKGVITLTNLKFSRPVNKAGENGIELTSIYTKTPKLHTIDSSTKGTTKITYNYDKESGWEGLNFKIAEEKAVVTKYLHLTGTVSSDKKTNVIIKLFDHCKAEFKAEPLEANKEVAIDLVIPDWAVDTTKECFIFAGFNCQETDKGIAKSATITIKDLKLTSIANNTLVDGKLPVTIINDNEGGYNIAREAGKITISLDKPKDNWAAAYFLNGTNAENLKKVTGTFTCSVDAEIIFKCYDDNANEVNFTLKANEPYNLEKVLTNVNVNNRCLIFVRNEKLPAETTKLTGVLTIENLVFQEAVIA